MPASNRLAQQLVAFLEAVWSATTETAAALMAVERVAEALDAEIAAIVCGNRVVAVVGFPEGAVPVQELTLIAAGLHHELTVPGVGACRAAAVSLDHPAGATFIVARAGPDGGLGHEEASLLRGMGRVTSMAMRTQRLLDDERAARAESDRQATENARLLAELTHRQLRLAELAGEQAALRRVATLVAAQADADRIFAAVAEEVGHVVPAVDFAMVGRYGPDGAVRVVGGWSRAGIQLVGLQAPLGGRNVSTLVFESQQPARADHLTDRTSAVTVAAREMGMRSSAGAPISVEGQLWGVMIVASAHEDALPAGAEHRLAGFTELVATAIANAEAQSALAASRARIVATADQTRRRIERDLHDGAQQRLVTLGLQLRAAQAAVPPAASEMGELLDGVVTGLDGVLEELREIARGIHPAILTKGGLRPALKMLARRSAVPVDLTVRAGHRLPDQVEIAAYYAISEALTNTVKHAHASLVHVQVDDGDSVLHVRVHDDGCGGALFTGGSGLVGLKDRVEALGGRIWLHSPPGAGTTMQIALPIRDSSGPGPPAEVTGPSGEVSRRPAAGPGPPGPPRAS